MTVQKKTMVWEYLGGGWLPGVPARTLTEEEVKARGLKTADLKASGLYRKMSVVPLESEKKEGEDNG